MSKQIKPGMLCIIMGSETKELNGMIVEVISRPNRAWFTSTTGEEHGFLIDPKTSWVCKASKPLPAESIGSLKIDYFNERPIDEGCLIPISDPDIELTTEEMKELETI